MRTRSGSSRADPDAPPLVLDDVAGLVEKRKDALVRRRNVLSRAERVERLKKDEKWEEGMSVLGLPKLKVAAAPKAQKAKAPEAAEAAEGDSKE